jgi:pyridoxamine-phosphate oxidase
MTSTIKITGHETYNSPTHISPSNVHPDPLAQFRQWFKEAYENPAVHEPEAMSLSTVSAAGVPSARIVLLKAVDETGFVLFTNYTSRKSRELKENPRAALAFYWREQHRQVRVVGRAEMVDRRESEEYFQSRPVGGRVGSWASRQSSVVAEDEVQERYSRLEARFGVKNGDASAPSETSVPLPEFWGGWRIVPE